MAPPFLRSDRQFNYGLLGLLTICLTVILGCSQIIRPSNPPEPHEIRIGVIASLTGEAASIGESTVRGATLAVQEINRGDGLKLGRHTYRIQLLVEDDQDEVDAALDAARQLIFQDEVAVIVGPQYSRNAIPVAQFVETNQVPLITPRATNPDITAGKRYVFRTIFTDPFQGKVMADFARIDLGAKTAAVLYDVASAYNRGIAEVFKQVFEENGGEVAAFLDYTTGTMDFSSQLATIQATDPDVLFLPNYNVEVSLQAQQSRAVGIESILLGADAWGSIPPEKLPSLEGAFFSDQYAPDSTRPITRTFIQHYQQAYGEKPQASAAATYDALKLIFQAIQQQGQGSTSAIRQGLATMGRYEGVTGVIEYQGTGDPDCSVVILKIQEGTSVFYKQVDPA